MQRISRGEVRRRIATENPWWESPHQVPAPFSAMRPRAYLNLLLPLVTGSARRAVVMLGPRRVGKTVLIYHTVQRLLAQGVKPRQICYFSVDHPLYTDLSLEDLLTAGDEASGGELLSGTAHAFFDEIQYLKDWERHLKALVDGRAALRATASGSAAAALRLKSTESGAGRFTEFLLPPLTFREYLDLLGLDDLLTVYVKNKGVWEDHIVRLNERFVHYLNYGGYPEILFSADVQADAHRFIKGDIIDKVLLRDLPSLYGIQDIQELNALFTTLAYNTANEVSLDALASRAGVAKPTIRRYLEYLEAAFLIRVVHRLGRRGRRFQRANFFKVYLTNPSMRSALFAPIGPEDEAIGQLVETGVVSQFFHAPQEVFYGRWSGGEVDIVHLSPVQRVRSALEVKWSDRWAERPLELKSLLAFCRSNGLQRATVTTRTVWVERMIDDIRLIFRPASHHAVFVSDAVLDTKRFLASGLS